MSRKRILAVTGALLIFGALTLWIIDLRRPLSSKAGSALESMTEGDARALMAYASPREVQEEDLTQDKLQRVLDKLILPNISRDKASEPKTQDDTGDFHALNMHDVVTKDGRRVRVGFDLWKSDDGLVTNVLGSVLRNAWDLRYKPTGDYAKPSDMFRSGVRGIEEDEAFLTSIGLKGLASKDPTKPFSTWQEIAARNRDLMARM